MFNEIIILLSDACSHAPRFVQSYTLLPVSQLAVLLPELYGNIRGSSRGWCLLQNLRFREVYSLESLRFIGFYSLAKFTLQQSLLFSKVYSLAKFTLKQSLRFSEEINILILSLICRICEESCTGDYSVVEYVKNLAGVTIVL